MRRARAILTAIREAPRAPLALAALLASLLYFAAVLAASLAVERPQVFKYLHLAKHAEKARPIERQTTPTGANELKIYALAVAVALGLVVVGLLCTWRYSMIAVVIAEAVGFAILLPFPSFHHVIPAIEAVITYAPIVVIAGGAAAVLLHDGAYASCASAAAFAIALPVHIDRWVHHHTQRFTWGMDLIIDRDPGSQLSQGDWERSVRETVFSLCHYVELLAAGLVVALALSRIRRVREATRQIGSGTVETVGVPGAIASLDAESRTARRGAFFGRGRSPRT